MAPPLGVEDWAGSGRPCDTDEGTASRDIQRDRCEDQRWAASRKAPKLAFSAPCHSIDIARQMRHRNGEETSTLRSMRYTADICRPWGSFKMQTTRAPHIHGGNRCEGRHCLPTPPPPDAWLRPSDGPAIRLAREPSAQGCRSRPEAPRLRPALPDRHRLRMLASAVQVWCDWLRTALEKKVWEVRHRHSIIWNCPLFVDRLRAFPAGRPREPRTNARAPQSRSSGS